MGSKPWHHLGSSHTCLCAALSREGWHCLPAAGDTEGCRPCPQPLGVPTGLLLEAVPWHGRGKAPPAPLLPLAPTHPIPQGTESPSGVGRHRGHGACCAQRGSNATCATAAAPKFNGIIHFYGIIHGYGIIQWFWLPGGSCWKPCETQLLPGTTLAQSGWLAPAGGLCLGTVPRRAVRLSGDRDCPLVPQSRAEGQGQKHPVCSSLLCPSPRRAGRWHQPPKAHIPALPPPAPRPDVLGTSFLGLQQPLVSDCNP